MKTGCPLKKSYTIRPSEAKLESACDEGKEQTFERLQKPPASLYWQRSSSLADMPFRNMMTACFMCYVYIRLSILLNFNCILVIINYTDKRVFITRTTEFALFLVVYENFTFVRSLRNFLGRPGEGILQLHF